MSNQVGIVISKEPVLAEEIDYLLSAAFEGGINYWCNRVAPVDMKFPEGASYASECISRGTSLVLTDFINDEKILLNLDMMLEGIQLWCARVHQTWHQVYEDHDAAVADAIVQLACFKEIVYG